MKVWKLEACMKEKQKFYHNFNPLTTINTTHNLHYMKLLHSNLQQWDIKKDSKIESQLNIKSLTVKWDKRWKGEHCCLYWFERRCIIIILKYELQILTKLLEILKRGRRNNLNWKKKSSFYPIYVSNESPWVNGKNLS